MTNEDSIGNQSSAQTPAIPTSMPVSSPAAVTKKESTGDIWKSTGKDAVETVGNIETVIGTPRQIIDAALLGICVTFLIAMLTMQPAAIDARLHNAIIAFGFTLPLIGWGYVQSTVRAKPGKGRLTLQAVLIGSAAAEGVGELAAVIGIFFIFRHFSSDASAAFIWSAVFAIGIVPVLSFIGLFVYAVVNRKELAAKQQAKSTTPPAPEQTAISQTANNP